MNSFTPPKLLESQYMLRYLLAWNTAMTGDLDAVKFADESPEPTADLLEPTTYVGEFAR